MSPPTGDQPGVEDKPLTLSVVMPVYNEAKTLREIVGRVRRVDIPKTLIIVDDGSTDGTRAMLKEYEGEEDVRVIYREENAGKGAAVRTGLAEADGDIVIIQDADLEYDPNEYHDLIAPIVRGDADVVYGSRLSGGRPQRVYLFWHKAGNVFLNLVTNILYNTTLTDMETCYKAFTREVKESLHLTANKFNLEPEITAKIFRQNRFRVYEIPISYYGRSFAEGKKICWLDGFSALWMLLKCRFIP